MPKFAKSRINGQKKIKSILENISKKKHKNLDIEDLMDLQEVSIKETQDAVVIHVNEGFHFLCAEKPKFIYPTHPPLKSKYTAQEIINLIAKTGYIDTPCKHYLIGASTLEALARNDVTFASTHRKFTTFAAMHHGKIAEKAFMDNYLQHNTGKITQQPSFRSWRIPFLCSTGDFVIQEGEESVYVEIKSTKNQKDAENIPSNKRYLMQIWITMDILGINKGRLLVYLTDSSPVPRVKKILDVKITRSVELITSKTGKVLIDGYIVFLETFFKVLNIPFDYSDHLHASKVFFGCLKRIEKKILLSTDSSLACKYFSNSMIGEESMKFEEPDKQKRKKLKKDFLTFKSIKKFKDAVHNTAIKTRRKSSYQIPPVAKHSDDQRDRYQNISYKLCENLLIDCLSINFDTENRKIMFSKYVPVRVDSQK